jgi:endonuclease-3
MPKPRRSPGSPQGKVAADTRAAGPSDKQPFDFDLAVRLLREAVRPYPRAALFELAAEGFGSVFEILVACIISIRTRDEVTLPTARGLFSKVRTPAEVAALTVKQLDALIANCMYHETKAKTIRDIARQTVTRHDGELPCDPEALLAFHGVGPKCANLALGIACGRPFIGVDVHVHRITNRWGIVQAATPEKTMLALEQVLPQRYWVEINALLVPFGKHVCTGVSPKCSTCPLLDMCGQVGVTSHR